MSQSCFHCGDRVINNRYVVEDHLFCCNGCKSVYLLLRDSDLDEFYQLEPGAGQKPTNQADHKYEFLNVESIASKYIAFENDQYISLTLFLPQIHCSSCVYLLENLAKIEPAIESCQTNFTKREATLTFDKHQLKLSELAELLDRIGYPPNFEDRSKVQKKIDRQFLYKLGVAAFAFGSIMLWSFPEYLGIDRAHYEYRDFMAYLSFAISLPVLLFSANEYLISAYKALRAKSINIDVPISLGIVALYLQSCLHIFSGQGPGYMDSFAGFIFFLLIGKWFQNRTYQSLSFDRDPRAYFPVAVIRAVNGKEEIVEIEKLEVDEVMIIRNEEIVPCDAVVLSETVTLDYSFVTGESIPIKLHKGDVVYAGGKLIGKRGQFSVTKKSERSRLAELWNSAERSVEQKTDRLSLIFLILLLIVAAIGGVSWFLIDASLVFKVVVSVLIVACPCALALSKPFTLGNTVQKMGRNGYFAKNTDAVERMNEVTDIVFDKTGTLTKGSYDKVEFVGNELPKDLVEKIVLVVQSSTHPLSRAIYSHFGDQFYLGNEEVERFEEIEGKGIVARVGGIEVRLGSASFVGAENENTAHETVSHLRIDEVYYGKFVFESELRSGITELLTRLSATKKIHVLSGDSNKDHQLLLNALPTLKDIHFSQSPQNKRDYIQQLQSEGKKVMMIGDGLNDAGALKLANVALAVSEDVFQFTPNSDVIVKADQLYRLDSMLKLTKYASTVLTICILFSILYNSIGLTFALSGSLTPLVAAILMPVSSITIVFISTILVRIKNV